MFEFHKPATGLARKSITGTVPRESWLSALRMDNYRQLIPLTLLFLRQNSGRSSDRGPVTLEEAATYHA